MMVSELDGTLYRRPLESVEQKTVKNMAAGEDFL
jgi:hypothetical protein